MTLSTDSVCTNTKKYSLKQYHNFIIYKEWARFAHSFLLHLLETSTYAGINNCTPQLYLGLCCMHDVGSSVGQIAARTAQPAVYAHVHIVDQRKRDSNDNKQYTQLNTRGMTSCLNIEYSTKYTIAYALHKSVSSECTSSVS